MYNHRTSHASRNNCVGNRYENIQEEVVCRMLFVYAPWTFMDFGPKRSDWAQNWHFGPNVDLFGPDENIHTESCIYDVVCFCCGSLGIYIMGVATCQPAITIAYFIQ